MRLRRLTLVAPAFFWILLGLSRDVEAVHVHTTQELVNAVGQANTGGDRRIVVHEGVYDLDNMLWISADNVTVRGASGDREAVIIQGKGMGGSVTHVFNVAGSQFCVTYSERFPNLRASKGGRKASPYVLRDYLPGWWGIHPRPHSMRFDGSPRRQNRST